MAVPVPGQTAWGAQKKKIKPEDFKAISQGTAKYDTSKQSVVPTPPQTTKTTTTATTPTPGVMGPPSPTGTSKTATTTANVPAPPNPHQEYLNKTGSFGGSNAYAASQQQRFNQAYNSGDSDLVKRLQDDAKRVGYTLNVPVPPQAQQQTATQTQAQVSTPTANEVYTPRSSDQLQQSSGDSIALERAALLRSSTELINNLKNNAQYSNQLIRDNRALEDWKFRNSNDPTNGRTAFMAGTLERGRQIDDTYRASELNGKLNTISQELADFDKLTPERQRQIYNELLKLERDFALNQGQLTGNYGGQRTLQGQQFDRSVYESDRDFNYGAGRDQIADQRYEREWDYGVGRDQIGDTRYDQEWNYQVGRDQVADQRYDQEWDRGIYESDRDYALRKQQESRIAANSGGGSSGGSNGSQSSGQPKPISTGEMNTITNMLNERYTIKSENGQIRVSNPYAMRQAIIALDLPNDEDTDKLLRYYGLSVSDGSGDIWSQYKGGAPR